MFILYSEKMNAVIDNILEKSDFVWDKVVDHLPSKSKRSRTNFINFNCPMCILEGEKSADTKMRCGISKTNNGMSIYCFNCGFKTSYVIGRRLTRKFKSFLRQVNVSDLEIDQLNHRAFQLARIMGSVSGDIIIDRFVPNFPSRKLPENSKPLTQWANEDMDDASFIRAASYAMSRGDVVVDNAYWSPKHPDRLIFPCYHRDKIVGWTGRLVYEDKAIPRYINEVPANFLSNCDVLYDYHRKYIFLPEGFLDALAIDGISPFGAKLSDKQISWIKETGKEVVVIPDRDFSGEKLIDVAVKHGWSVSFPRLTRSGNNWWESDCKDCCEAVNRYGKLYTLQSIIKTSTKSKMEIEVKRKWLY